MTTRTSLAVLLLTGVLAALSWGCADALPSGDSDSHGPLLDKLRRVSRSPQLPNAGEIAEKARDLAKTARDMAQQHISERVADLKDKVEAARSAAASLQAQGAELPSSVTNMANNS